MKFNDFGDDYFGYGDELDNQEKGYNVWDDLEALVDEFYDVFKDDNLRAFAYGKNCPDNTFTRERMLDDMNNNTALYDMCYGITNAVFTYLVSRFTKIITRERNPLENNSKEASVSFCVERIEDAIFGLYDTYDATDDIVQFVVFNTALAVKSNEKLRNELGFKDKSYFYEQEVEGSDDAEGQKDNLLTIFRWMNYLQKLEYPSLMAEINYNKSLFISKLRQLLSYVAFCREIELVKADNSNSMNMVVSQSRTSKEIYETNFIVLSGGNGKYFMLRSVESNKETQNKKLLLRYTNSNCSDTNRRRNWTVVTNAAEDDKEFSTIVVSSIGETYNKITYGLLRKRSRSPFCGGLTGFKYYSEFASSVIDALENLTPLKTRARTMTETYFKPLIERNFSICRDECICKCTSCPYSKGSNKEQPCLGKKRFSDKTAIKPQCIMNMRILPILTILFTVSGCKTILPQIFNAYKDEAVNLIDQINKQLKVRFPSFNEKRVNDLTNKIYNHSKTGIIDFKQDEDDLPKAIKINLKKLMSEAYTEAVIKELESINVDGKTEVVAEKISKMNVNSYSLTERMDTIDEFINKCNQVNETDLDVEIDYAMDSLRRAVETVVCYNEGMRNCWKSQLSYQASVEKRMNISQGEAREAKDRIVGSFLDAASEKAAVLNKNNSIYELFRSLVEQSSDDDVLDAVNILLGRDVIDVEDLMRYVVIDNDRKEIRLKHPSGSIFPEQPLDDIKELWADWEPKKIKTFFECVKNVLGYFYNKNEENEVGIYPQVLTFSSTMTNRDGNIIRKFVYNNYGMTKEYNVFTFFNYSENKKYFFVPPKKYEVSNWLTHPILIDCTKFQARIFGDDEGGQE